MILEEGRFGEDDVVSLGVAEWEMPGGLPDGCPMSHLCVFWDSGQV